MFAKCTVAVWFVLTVAGRGVAAPSAPAPAARSPLPFPHPLITEVFFDVPKGDAGDADHDGHRSATGDEFIELVNPHRESISLKGYTLHDLSGGKKSSLKFTFPDVTLKPGQVAVVFNGFESKRSFAAEGAAPTPNAEFAGALLFSMRMDFGRAALANAGDTIVLEDPDGKPVHVIWWGKVEGEKPKAPLVETFKDVESCSAARRDAGAPLVEHTKLMPGVCSPGVFPHDPPAEGASPAGKGAAKPGKAPAAEKPKDKKGG